MNKISFIEYLKDLNIEVNDTLLSKFEQYKELLQEYNKKFNLTSILDDEEIYLKHFYDSLCLLKTNKIKNNLSLLDIGTGAGFPGMPLAIIMPSLKITLIESNSKKCEFLNIIKETLNLNNVEIINSRAEDYVKTKRETFDIATSRAVSNIKVLLELEIPALKVNGYFLPLKGEVEEELELSEKLINELNSKIENIIEYNLPNNAGKRTIPIIIKEKETNTLYPRNYSKIMKELEKSKFDKSK